MSSARVVPPEDRMNKTERAYATVLDARVKAGEVRAWHYEGLTLKLADDTRYTPDFFVVLADWTCELHEVKGFWRDDAKVKTKVAARMYPFPIYAVTREGRSGFGFKVERVPA